jgi:hypothetical protein
VAVACASPQFVVRQRDPNRAGLTWSPADQTAFLELDNHLVDGGGVTWMPIAARWPARWSTRTPPGPANRPAIRCTAAHPTTSPETLTRSDSAGHFRIAGLARGAYRLRISGGDAVPSIMDVDAPRDALAVRLSPGPLRSACGSQACNRQVDRPC